MALFPCLFLAVVVPAPSFDYSQPKPFLAVWHTPSQSIPHLTMWATGPLQLSACLPSSCPHVLGHASHRCSGSCCSHLCMAPRCWLLSPCNSCLSAPFLSCQCNGTESNYFLVHPWDLGPRTLKIPRSVKVWVHLKKTCSTTDNPPSPCTYFKSS